MSYSGKTFPITRVSRSSLVSPFAVAPGFGNRRPRRALGPADCDSGGGLAWTYAGSPRRAECAALGTGEVRAACWMPKYDPTDSEFWPGFPGVVVLNPPPSAARAA